MAHANLHIVDEIIRAWHEAHDWPYGWIQLTIDPSKELINLGETNENSSNVEDAFHALIETANVDKTPCIFLFKLDQAHWILISYVLDSVSARLRTLFASSRDDIKQKLNRNVFTADYHISSDEELSYDEFVAWKADEQRPSCLMTDNELQLHEEKLAASVTRAVSSSSSSSALVPYKFDESIRTDLKNLAQNKATFIIAQINVDSEKFTTVACGSDLASESAVSLAKSSDCSLTEPLYLIVPLAKQGETDKTTAALILYCPDEAPVKHRVLASSAKATLAQVANDEYNIDCTKMEQVSDLDDLQELLVSLQTTNNSDSDTKSTEQSSPSKLSLASDSPSLASRPTRPGRGKSRLMRAK